MTTQDISRALPVFTDDVLRSIDSFDAAIALANEYVKEHGGAIESTEDYGTGFKILENKDALVGVPCFLLDWRFSEGDFGGFVSVEIVTKNGDKFILNDGSTGIYRMLQSVTEARIKAGVPNTHALLGAPTGLTKSEFFFNEATKETRTRIPEDASAAERKNWKPASTYYFAQ